MGECIEMCGLWKIEGLCVFFIGINGILLLIWLLQVDVEVSEMVNCLVFLVEFVLKVEQVLVGELVFVFDNFNVVCVRCIESFDVEVVGDEIMVDGQKLSIVLWQEMGVGVDGFVFGGMLWNLMEYFVVFVEV